MNFDNYRSLTVIIGGKTVVLEDCNAEDSRVQTLLELASRTEVRLEITVPPISEVTSALGSLEFGEPKIEPLLPLLVMRVDDVRLGLSKNAAQMLIDGGYEYIYEVLMIKIDNPEHGRDLFKPHHEEVVRRIGNLPGLWFGMDLWEYSTYFDREILKSPTMGEKRRLAALNYSWEEFMGLSPHTYSCFSNAGITRVWQVAQKNESELRQLDHFKMPSLREVREILKRMELSLDMDLSEYKDQLIHETQQDDTSSQAISSLEEQLPKE